MLFCFYKISRLKKNSVFVIALAFLSILEGYLLSAISFVGRAGITVMYTQYQFLKSWWKGAVLVFIVWMVLFLVQSIVKNKASRVAAALIQVALLLVAATGLVLSYSDFHNSLSHRLLGLRFHLGVYLFWAVWMAISIYQLLRKKPLTETPIIEYNQLQ